MVFVVQRLVNSVQLVQSWFDTGPALVYVLFMGAISDHLGKKLILMIPLTGKIQNKPFFSFIDISSPIRRCPHQRVITYTYMYV